CAEGALGSSRGHRHGGARHLDLRGPHRDRESTLLVRDGRPRRHAPEAPSRAGVGGARHGSGTPRAHLLGGNETAARPRPCPPRGGAGPPPRRAPPRPRSRGAGGAGGGSPVLSSAPGGPRGGAPPPRRGGWGGGVGGRPLR